MPRALVTGATGFVGSNLVALLRSRDWEVHCLVRDKARAEFLQQLGAKLFLGTLADQESIESAMVGVDYVFHVAGRVRALAEEEFERDNVEGTRHVMQAATLQAQSPVVVYVSSLAAGGPSRRDIPRVEADEDQPISAYGQSKHNAERTAATFADEVPLSIVRPPIIFGEADQASLSIFKSVKWTRIHPVPGFRRFHVSLVHVADLCDAMVRIAESGERVVPLNKQPREKSQGVYYVCAERDITYGQLGKLAAQSLGCGSLTLPLPLPLFWVAGVVAEVIGQARRDPAVLNLDKIREVAASGWVCSDRKLQEQLGYKPAANLVERFAQTAAWYLKQGWL